MNDTVHRAFELAKSGACRSVDDVRRELLKTGHEAVESHLSGATIKRQLSAAIKAAADA